MLAALSDWLTTAPLSFIVGVVVGLSLASRFRIVRAKRPNMTDNGGNDA
jgi:hypothetical protein